MQERIYIQYERSGGFAGITTKIEFVSDSLPAAEVEQLEQMIVESDFLKFHANDSTRENATDQFSYKLTIEYNNERNTVELSETTIPESFRPLFNYLNQKARSRK